MTPPPAPALPSLPPPEWDLRSPPDASLVDRLARELSLPRSVCRLLVVRQLADPTEAKRFLRPRVDDLHPPLTLRGMAQAVDRILTARTEGETILVHGDYDVDGVCAVALLTLWLRRLGASVVPFVPHRIEHGYDFGEAGLRQAQAAGASLVITCDSGMLAHEWVARAAASGIDVIVTDHHTPGESLPGAVAVVNPHRADCPYPEAVLCGTGVVFKLCQALADGGGVPAEELWPHLDLVALATVADLVPLTGENRILVRVGLRFLRETGKVGLRALLDVSGLTPGEEVDAGQVGFTVAPRINAVGRMGHADAAVRLLLTDDPSEARELARMLDETNGRRQEEDRATLDDVLGRLAARFDPTTDFGLVLAGEGWHPGVIGIVASRVVERIHRPVVLVALDGERGRGSGRSIPGVHLVEALQDCAAHLVRFGGHRQAAGLEVTRAELPALRDAFNRSVKRQLGGRIPSPRVGGDLGLPLEEADDELYRLLSHVGPFGMGNPRPVFWARGLRVVGPPRVVGRGHLKLTFAEGDRRLDAIGFGLADRVPPELLGADRVDALFQLRMNEYRGRRTLQARVIDLRPWVPPASA